MPAEVKPRPGEEQLMADNDGDNLFDRLLNVWWGYFVLAAVFFGLAFLCHWHISAIEARGGGRVYWLVALVYNWAGKTGTVLLFAIPGALLALVGVWKLLKRDDDSE